MTLRPNIKVRAYLCRDRLTRSGVLAWVRPVKPGPHQTWADKAHPRGRLVLSSLCTPRDVLTLMEEIVEPGGCVEVTLVLRQRAERTVGP